MATEASQEAAHGFSFHAEELLLIGNYPELAQVRNDAVRTQLQQLIAAGRRIKPKELRTPAETHVSAAQVAARFAEGRLMVATVGKNRVESQPWGHPRTVLAAWPGEAPGQTTTLWFPLTAGADGPNLRWRVALA